ncbi:MAG: DUF58 domain-containing protein [Deltaproteobacteria bacterium]|jgi:uncharacterized protein (DUF58 family)|nr:DUF58 domain-containing protein [Deltaproteobacteria bacterium]
MRPTPKMAAIFAVSAPLTLALLIGFGFSWPTALAYPAVCALIFLVDLAWTPSPEEISAASYYPWRISIGQTEAAYVDVSEKKPAKRSFQAKLEFEGPLADLDSPRLQETKEAATLRLVFPLRPRRRGRLLIEALWLRWIGPLGLCARKKIVPARVSVEVVQDVEKLSDKALSFLFRESDPGLKSLTFRGEGTEFDSLAEHAQGMDNRFIDWKRSARHRKLLSKEFKLERNNQLILGFDTGRLMREDVLGVPKLDHYVKAGLLMAWVGLKSGDLVGSADFSQKLNGFLKPGRGKPFFARLQSFTASLDYRPHETNFVAGLCDLKTQLAHRSLVVIFTEFVDSISAEFLLEGLSLLVKKHAVIFVSATDATLGRLTDSPPLSVRDMATAVIADNFRRDRAIVMERVARLGVHVVETPPKYLSASILNKYLSLKQRGLL